ncbi:MAG: 5'-3' exonuclease H3TH domain-containing protein [Ilumatobacteraceae bacterium]
MQVHLVDGTYELYRQHYGQAVHHRDPPPFAGTIGVLTSTIQLLADGATHIGVATDHVIESFRNELYSGYKTSEGMEKVLLDQIPVVEDALESLGVAVWSMVEYEADDALGSAVEVAIDDRRVHKVLILTPDKDLGQCVKGKRVVQLDRRTNTIIDESALRAKFGVGPDSIADYLALVGDSADGFPGLSGWGAKSASVLLAKYRSIDLIPDDHKQWIVDGVVVRGAEKLATTLRDHRADAELFRILATLVTTVPVGTVDDWKWNGPTARFDEVATRIGAPQLIERLHRMK